MEMPLISVLMVNYNHVKHIGKSIESVLAQTYSNLQFVIVDDGSTDGSREIIEKYNDPRIEKHFLDENHHISYATNYGFKKISGTYLARIDSDDTWVLDKLEKQLLFLEHNPSCKVVFSWVNIIDENDDIINDRQSDLLRLYESHTRTQEEWLQFFFYSGNCLAQPSILMDANLLSEIGEFNLAYKQSHDFDYWVRIAKKYQIFVQEERLINVRRFENFQEKNTSSLDEEPSTRFYNEYAMIRYSFFDDMSSELFTSSFRENFRHSDSITEEELECEKAFLLCFNPHHSIPVPILGLQKLEILMRSEKYVKLLGAKYDFTPINFYGLNGQHLYYDRYVKESYEKYSSMETKLQISREELKEVSRQLKVTQEALESLQNSTCWKMTKPIRSVMDTIKSSKK